MQSKSHHLVAGKKSLEQRQKELDNFIQALVATDDPGFDINLPLANRSPRKALYSSSKKAIAWETPLSAKAYGFRKMLDRWRHYAIKKTILPVEKQLLALWNERREQPSRDEAIMDRLGEHPGQLSFQATASDAWDQELIKAIDQYNAWIETARAEFRHQQVTAHNTNRDQAQRNLNNGLEYIEALRQRYARLVSVRVDLFYRTEYRAELDLKALQEARRRYFKRIKKHSAFNALVGYIWVIEDGSEKGLHLHLLVFFDGSRARQDHTLGNLLGEHWEQLTGGQGAYYNSNRENSKMSLMKWQRSPQCLEQLESFFPGRGEIFHQKILQAQDAGLNSLGVGVINHNNESAWINLRRLVHYFCKLEQRIPSVQRQGIRCFGKGTMPAQPSNRGRPRAFSINPIDH